MEYLAETDELVLEYLVFRGFTEAFRAFVAERAEDRLQSLNAARVAQQLLRLAEEFELDALVELWDFLDRRCFAGLDAVLAETALRLKASLFKLFMVSAKRQNRMEKLLHIFDTDVLNRQSAIDPAAASSGADPGSWHTWYALPYCRDPYRDPEFAPFFEQDWADLLAISLHNFLADVFRAQQAPRLLSFPLHGRKLRATRAELHAKEFECARLEQETRRLRRMLENRQDSPGTQDSLGFQAGADSSLDGLSNDKRNGGSSSSTSGSGPVEQVEVQEGADTPKRLSQFAEGRHASRVNLCRFAPPMGASESRALVTASQDGTVRVWSWRSAPKCEVVQDQVIFCASEALSLDWHPERPELLAIGHANSTIRLWDVHSRSQVSEFVVSGEPTLPFVSEVCMSARRQVLASLSTGQGSTAIRRGSEGLDRHAALFAPRAHPGGTGTAPLYTQKVSRRSCVQIWSTTTSQLVASLAESDSYQTTSICFNHNGSLLVTGASDGSVRVVDVQKMSSIMEFKVAECAVVKLTLTPDETAVVVIAADGGLSQWSLHRVSAPLFTIDGPGKGGEDRARSPAESWSSTWKPAGDLVSSSDATQACFACSPRFGNVVKVFGQQRADVFGLADDEADTAVSRAPTSIDWAQGVLVASYESGRVRAFKFKGGSPLQGMMR